MSGELRTGFHEQLDEVRTAIARLGAGVTELVPRVTEILLDGDLEGAEYVILGDRVYDAFAPQGALYNHDAEDPDGMVELNNRHREAEPRQLAAYPSSDPP